MPGEKPSRVSRGNSGTVELPWVPQVSDANAAHTKSVKQGAFRITSSPWICSTEHCPADPGEQVKRKEKGHRTHAVSLVPFQASPSRKQWCIILKLRGP